MKCTLSSKHKISMDIGPKINSSRISNLDMILLDQFFLFGPPSPGRCPNHDSCASIFLESQGEINCFNGFHCTHGLISTQMMFGDENARVCIQIPVEKRSEMQNACEPHNPYAWWIGRTPLSQTYNGVHAKFLFASVIFRIFGIYQTFQMKINKFCTIARI